MVAISGLYKLFNPYIYKVFDKRLIVLDDLNHEYDSGQ